MHDFINFINPLVAMAEMSNFNERTFLRYRAIGQRMSL